MPREERDHIHLLADRRPKTAVRSEDEETGVKVSHSGRLILDG